MSRSTATYSIVRRSAAVAVSAMLAAGCVPAAALADITAADATESAAANTSAASADATLSTSSDYDRASLADGTYDLAVALNRADKPDTASMAGASVDGAAKLVVENGSYSVQVTLKTMMVMGVVGDITQMAYYPGGYVADGVAYFQGQTVKADVLSTRESDGATYPAVVSIPLSAAMISDGYVLVGVTTTGMSGADGAAATVQAVLKLDWAAFDKAHGSTNQKADRSALTAQIDAAKAITRGQAAAVDWNLLQNEITRAQDVLANDDATQAEIDAETTTLSQAVDRFNGTCDLTCREGYFYLMSGQWVQESGQASGAFAFFADNVEVRAASDAAGTYSIRITPKAAEGASITGITYAQGTEAKKVTTASASASQSTTDQYELFASSLTGAIRISYTLSVNGSTLTQFGYLVLDYANASEVADTVPTPDPEPEPKPDPTPAFAFSDVSDPSAWYYASTYEAARLGYMTGYAGTDLFGPDDTLTRGQAACVLANMANCGGRNTPWSGEFSDVGAGDYFAGAVAWAKASGVAGGYSGTDLFGPWDNLTREQMAQLLYNYANSIDGADVSVADPDAELARFGDADGVSGWAREAVAWALSRHIMGNGGFINAQGEITRAEAAKMAVNFQPEAKPAR